MKNFERLAVLGILASGVMLPALAQQSTAPGTQQGLSRLFSNTHEDELIDPDKAFRMIATASGPAALEVQLLPAKGYYLYRDKVRFVLKDAPGITIAGVDLPKGEIKTDQTFGKTEVYKTPVTARVSLNRAAGNNRATLVASYQGCHEKLGVCYPPVQQIVTLALP